MNAWRVTPSRRASWRSISRNRSTGKSTLTRWIARPGRVGLAEIHVRLQVNAGVVLGVELGGRECLSLGGTLPFLHSVLAWRGDDPDAIAPHGDER